MKNYLLVSQCQGKSLRTTRRIASSFLSRLGDTTWHGTLSEEALRILVLALKRQANQNSCIAVYDVSGRARRKVVHIGNLRRYSSDGDYAFSVHAGSTKPQGNLSSMMPLLSKMTVLAGLLHDLGKGTVRFQDKLDYGVKHDKGLADAIRHEVISVLMAEPLLAFLAKSDQQVIQTNPRLIGDWCTEFLQKSLTKFKASDHDDLTRQSSLIAGHLSTKTFSSESWSRESIIHTSILWMILSHHHLPEGVQDDGLKVGIPYNPYGGSHYFLKIRDTNGIGDDENIEPITGFEVKDFNSNLTICTLSKTSAPVLQPWDDIEWCRAVIQAYRRLAKLEAAADHYLPKNAIEENSSWATALAYMGRTALVYADYMISSEKQPARRQRAPGAIYANTTKVLETSVYADTLTVHLLGVGRRAGQYFAQMFMQQDSVMHSFSSLSRDERNSLMPGLNKRSTDARYQWQDKVRDNLRPKASNSPFFGSVMGKTGAGKTRGNIMLMHAMKEDMRFTCAIGLRSLVNQTHKAYLEPFIGISDDHLALLVGESQGGANRASQDVQGTGNDLVQDTEMLLGDYIIEGQSIFNHPLGKLYDSKKQRAMLSQPVQVMTVDHIMPGASLGRSSELKLLLHLMGTDIVLDEIDDYPVSSQCALMRMAFVSGVFGRSFVLSSATATPIIQKAFFNAWQAGLSHHRQLFQFPGKEVSPRAVLVSHVEGSEAMLVDPENFDPACDRFVTAVVQEAAHNARHQIEIVTLGALPTDPPSHLSAFYKKKYLSYSQHQALVQQIKGAHDHHHVNSQEVSVSSGFVRFNNVRNAQHLALVLNQWVDDTTLFVPVCYHSQMMAMERQQIEALLLELNCRKSNATLNGDERILSHSLTLDAVKKAREGGMTQIIFVVCTTNLLEVGRDHDYDWAILEPASTRSMVQSCGRVWRHRNKFPFPGVANIWMFNKSVRALTGEEDETTKAKIKHLWSRFGIEDETLGDNHQNPLISMSVPLSEISRDALSELNIEMPSTLDGQVTKGTAFKKAVIGHQAILSCHKAWQSLFQLPYSRVHAGLCLEMPQNAACAFMQSMEAAHQHIHLRGSDKSGSALACQYPSGERYALEPVYRLTSHHPRQRRLRAPDEGYVLHYDAKRRGFAADGHARNNWWVTDKKGESKEFNFEFRKPATGWLWQPIALEEFLERNDQASSRASRIAIRKDQFEKLGDFFYMSGIGLLKKP